jgi:hypothetical protein
MDTKITLLVTGLILVVVTATIASSVHPVYAPGSCSSCGKILASGHNLIISSQARLLQALSAVRGAIISQQQNPTGQSPN